MNSNTLSDHELLTAAFIAANTGRYAEAIEHFSAALKRDPSDPFIRMTLAKCHHELGQSNHAQTQFNRVREMARTDPSLLLPLIDAYCETRQFQEALATARTAEKQETLRVAAATRQIEVYERLNRLDAAQEVVRRIGDMGLNANASLGLAYARVLEVVPKSWTAGWPE